MRISAPRMATMVAIGLLCACSRSVAPANNAAETQTVSFLIPLVIKTAHGDRRFDVETALTPEQQDKGLMFRRDIPDNGGMLFPMTPPRTASFWMKDTLIPLDMLFIHTDGTIAFLKANAQPYDRTPVSAGIPVAAVVELRGGRAAELGIAEGDRVAWGACAIGIVDETGDRGFCPAAPR